MFYMSYLFARSKFICSKIHIQCTLNVLLCTRKDYLWIQKMLLFWAIQNLIFSNYCNGLTYFVQKVHQLTWFMMYCNLLAAYTSITAVVMMYNDQFLMVLKLDNNSIHIAHAWRKISFFEKKIVCFRSNKMP